MSKHTHTLGPWQWNHGRLLHNVAGEYSETILDIEEEAWRPTDDDSKLIAAAPELLDALVNLLPLISPLKAESQQVANASAAIAKATGQ
ncbi:hypothetical protein [Pseudomonas aeruginosa]|uniref:hypothetical protein n=1 Tax=Pseudomonas aeruginosa TaxID=287 RepID=UPI00071BA7A8|nr:hypothetical protein [Pseudomonas aeruginosa]